MDSKSITEQSIISSAALFQTGVSSLLFSEAQFLDTLIKRNESFAKLDTANSQITQLCCCLRDLQVYIYEIISSNK